MTTKPCGARQAKCRCILSPGHDGAHVCDPVTCGGSWHYDDKGALVVDTWPLLSLFDTDDT